MSKYRIAELLIEICPNYDYTKQLCRPYKVDSEQEPDMYVAVTEQEILAEQVPDVQHSPGYLESLAIYRKIAEHLADFDGFLAHGAVIAKDGHAYMFCAPSGTGKTTHVRLWQELYPDALMVNGDKPIIRKKGDKWMAYGTPWAGKEGMQTNTGVPLCGICTLQRGQINRISPIDPEQRLTALARHVYFPHDARAAKTVSLVAVACSAIPMYSLYCNISQDAAQLSYQTMTKENV